LKRRATQPLPGQQSNVDFANRLQNHSILEAFLHGKQEAL
jgi:hypothetical protein